MIFRFLCVLVAGVPNPFDLVDPALFGFQVPTLDDFFYLIIITHIFKIYKYYMSEVETKIAIEDENVVNLLVKKKKNKKKNKPTEPVLELEGT